MKLAHLSLCFCLSLTGAAVSCANGTVQTGYPDAGDAANSDGAGGTGDGATEAGDAASDGAAATDGGGGGNGLGPEASWTEHIGYGCASQSECTGFHKIPTGKCVTVATAMVCTKACVAHSDCGCDVGTTDETISAGHCNAACGLDGFCKKVCQSTSDCVAGTCKALSTYTVCK